MITGVSVYSAGLPKLICASATIDFGTTPVRVVLCGECALCRKAEDGPPPCNGDTPLGQRAA